jgi:4-aminobutyrate aminotransferase-like enzyme/Ser/Thr protein kinase RdoA (MazF antagonist)
MQPLPGERDQNFLVHLSDDRRFVFKVCNPSEPFAVLTAQVKVLERLKSLDFVPKTLLTEVGKPIATISLDHNEYVVRTVSFLPGTPLANLRRPSPSLLADLGQKLARLDQALLGFDDAVLHRDFDWNLLNGLTVVHEHAQHISDENTRALVVRLAERIGRSLDSRRAELRQSTIHNDANDYNIIVSDGRDKHGERFVAGLIDFGDLARSYLVGELAIAIAYIACRRPDPLNVACELVAAYHRVLPLEAVELASLFDLVVLRLCVSLCMSARQQVERPDDTYLSISQEPIRRTLPILCELDASFVEARLRGACEMQPSATSINIVRWISSQKDQFWPVMGTQLNEQNSEVVDLSVASCRSEVYADTNDSVEKALARRTPIETNKRFVIGRYDERRLIYTSPQFDHSSDESAVVGETAERRSIHLGIDLFAPAGSDVFAPLNGNVYVSEYRNHDQDYGGVVILRHATPDGDAFYTLYGHLNRASVDGWAIGESVSAGESLGRLGSSDENGGWAPHLHLQVITDLLGLDGDFPGVAAASEGSVWTAFSPNPVCLAGIDDSLQAKCQAPGLRDALGNRQQHVASSLSTAYRTPLHLVRGCMQYLFDADGRRYLDAYNNVPHVGHCHPRVVAAAHEQMKTLNTNTRYLHELLNEYARRVTDTLPDKLDVCFFMNSASEANELAIRLARNATGRRGIVVQESAYHGHTTSLVDISPYKHDGPGGTGTPNWVHKVPLPDRFRGKFRADDTGQLYGEDAARLIHQVSRGKYPPAAFIAETLPSVGGQIVPPLEYFAIVYEAIRQAGGIAIADEVQTGFGRLGTNFWAFEKYCVTPDIVVMGKPMGNGHPIAAVVTTREVADPFDNGMEFFSTFGGNTVSCAVGLAVLDVIADEDLQCRALETGHVLQAGFRALARKFPLIGDVRGSGLFWGLELVRDPETLEPAGVEATLIANRLRDQGVLIGTDGPLHNVLKIRPPMPFNKENADYLVARLAHVLRTEF